MLWVNNAPDLNDSFVLDEGFWFGKGVFETIRVHELPLFWDRHICRLNAGLSALQIREPIDDAELYSQVQDFGIRFCVLKIAVTAENVIFQTRPLPADSSQAFTLMPVDNLRSRNPLLLSNKSLNYMDNLLAREQAAAKGFDDALFVEKNGAISETSRANIFFLKDGKIKTPDLACGILNGIVRQWVLDEFPVEAGEFSVDDLLTADAVLATNSVIGVRPVSQIGGQAIPIDSLALEICRRYQVILDNATDSI